MATNNSVVIFGASGNVGKFAVPALLKAGAKVTLVTRKGSKTTFQYENATVVTADYSSQSELVSIIRGHESVISLLSVEALSLQRNLIDAAIKARATLFIPSEFGHDTTNEDVTSLLPVLGVKTEIIEYLQEREKDGLNWTGIITALFFDWGLPQGNFGFDLKAGKATIWDGGNASFSAANLDDISAAIVKVVTDPSARERYKNQHVYVSSVQTTQNEILAAAEEVTGKKFEVAQFDSEEAFAYTTKPLPPGYSPQLLAVLAALQLSKRGLSDYQARVNAGHNRFVINAKRNVRDVLKAVVEEEAKI
ncbi:hypothetical protein TGAMA5MH_00837 [Trichoderma gamsii]|uniref:NmrA-like domain-containing protein n=1 Tax=Trichoderma gamsii TaxID=398673 RepID=A0A2K0TR54_9HYPO|nr:hypothetical protein TGAMA5MH_00837 [Trichoderma gamsii]